MMTRTTIRIQESLLDELKRRALQSGHSLTAEIDDLLRLGMKATQGKKKRINLTVCKSGGGVKPGINIYSTSELLEAAEGDAFL